MKKKEGMKRGEADKRQGRPRGGEGWRVRESEAEMVSRSIREIGSSKPNWPFAGSNRREEGFGRVETYYRVRWQDFFDAHAEGISMTCPVLDEVQNSTRRTTSSACKWRMAV